MNNFLYANKMSQMETINSMKLLNNMSYDLLLLLCTVIIIIIIIIIITIIIFRYFFAHHFLFQFIFYMLTDKQSNIH